MNAERLLAHYEQISDTPDAIGRLRRFILDLAVRGKLVPQDPRDEPASELLTRISKEKALLVKAGEIRTPKAIPTLPEPPFSIPSNWRWSQLAEIGVLSPRNEAPDALSVSFVPMPLIAVEYGVPNQHEIRPWGEIKKGYTHFAEGDVGLAKITPCFENGKSAVFRNLTGGIGAGTTELHIVRPLFVDQDYILLFLKSPHFIETGIPKMTGTAGQKRVPTEYFAHSPFPLPPLAEQRRIVAKVDELMDLCDQLKAARAEREATRDRLAASSLARLNAPDPDTFQHDARFVLNALPALTTRPDQIKQLRQTILNLAVRGKLVPQDPKEEPAAELLKRIAKEKLRLLHDNSTKAKQSIPRDSIVDSFNLPIGWLWCQLDELAWKITDGDHLTPKREPSGRYLLSARNVLNGRIDLSDVDYVGDVEFARMRNRCDPNKFDILISCSGSVGRVAVVDQDDAYVMVRSAALVKPVNANELAHYLAKALISDCLQVQMGLRSKAAAQPNLFIGPIRQLMIPLPPLAEQHRIVGKIDELMALCDQLEASLTDTAATRRRLLDALLAEALEPVETREVEAVA